MFRDEAAFPGQVGAGVGHFVGGGADGDYGGRDPGEECAPDCCPDGWSPVFLDEHFGVPFGAGVALFIVVARCRVAPLAPNGVPLLG